ncbi:MAG: hypothetical protein ABIR92_08715 [Gemmatimonadaceae bacterium]
MKFLARLFNNPWSRRLIRLIGTPLALIAALWHSLHTFSMWQQMELYKTTDPSASNFFYTQFQTELMVTVAAFFAGIFGWHMFKPLPLDRG